MLRALALGAAAAVALAACATAEDTADAPPVPDARVDAATTDAPVDACTPTAEICNGFNDDCDDNIDEDFAMLGDECSAGVGACVTPGVMVCADGGGGVVCNAVPPTPGIEVCNDVDDDCDELTDEGFGLGNTCDGADGDVCAEGVVQCNGAGGTTCTDATGTTTDFCNGANEDCDGATDEGYGVGNSCSAGVGACLTSGGMVCTGDGMGTQCDAVPGTPTAEFCGDAVDSDCNGSADPTCPSNDLATGQINISAGGTFTVDQTYAHNDDTSTIVGCGNPGGRDVFYTFTLGAPEVVYFDTFGSNFDTTLRIYNGSCPTRTGTPTCGDDSCSGLQSQLATQLPAGQYCLVVDQYSSNQVNGALTLRFVRGGRPGTAISTGTGTVSGTTAGGTNSSTPWCQTSSAPDVGYYFLVCPSSTPSLSATTCNAATNYDTVIYSRQGNATSGSQIACADDDAACGVSSLRSTIAPTVLGTSGLYWLIVDGYQANTGNYQISYTIN
jgi:hypothetical protein